MMEVLIGMLAFIVLVLAILQGWQMRKRRNSNPHGIISKLDDVVSKLDDVVSGLSGISAQLGRMEQRLNDVWDKIKGE